MSTRRIKITFFNKECRGLVVGCVKNLRNNRSIPILTPQTLDFKRTLNLSISIVFAIGNDGGSRCGLKTY